MTKETKRRSITIPKDLDDEIGLMADKFSYNFKNELYIELLELGLLKFKEDIELKYVLNKFIEKVDKLLTSLDNLSVG